MWRVTSSHFDTRRIFTILPARQPLSWERTLNTVCKRIPVSMFLLELVSLLSSWVEHLCTLFHQEFEPIWILKHLSDDLSHRLVWNRSEHRKGRFPWGSARSVSKDVRLSSNPDTHNIKLLQLQCPVRHLLTPPSVVQLRLAEDVVLVVDIAERLESFDQALMSNNTLPQCIQLALHRRPPHLGVIERLRNHTDHSRRPLGRVSLTKQSTPSIVACIDEHLQWPARSCWISSCRKVNMMQH